MSRIKSIIIVGELIIIAFLLAWVVKLKSGPVKSSESEIIHTLIVNDMRDILKLAVMEFNVSDVVENRIENYVNILSYPLYVGDKEMDLLVRGKMTVGFDLEKMGEGAFIKDEKLKAINVILPSPELIAVDTDYKFLNESKAFWLQIDEKERNRLMSMAKARLYEIARSKRLLDKAEFSGVERVEKYLKGLYPEYKVTITVVAPVRKEKSGDEG